MTERLSELEAGDDYDGTKSLREQFLGNVIAWLLEESATFGKSKIRLLVFR